MGRKKVGVSWADAKVEPSLDESRIRSSREPKRARNRLMTNEIPGSAPHSAWDGPRILFFTGGSALRPLSRVLPEITRNSIHVTTPFDSGGSSAELRRVLGVPAVGDLRNRALALADRERTEVDALVRFLGHRLPATGSLESARTLAARLPEAVPGPAEPSDAHIHVAADLAWILEKLDGTDFDFRGASVGNLALAARYLRNGRSLENACHALSELVSARGLVLPVTEADRHLAALLEDGQRLVGQHRITKRAPGGSRIVDLQLVRSVTEPIADIAEASPTVLREIARVDLIVFPMGSFFTSICANLLPSGVIASIQQSPARRVLVPSTGLDPEVAGFPLQLQIDWLHARGIDLDVVLLDDRDDVYPGGTRFSSDVAPRIERRTLVPPDGGEDLEPRALAGALADLVEARS